MRHALITFAVLLAACPEPIPGMPVEIPTILSVESALPLLEGTQLFVVVSNHSLLGDRPTLLVYGERVQEYRLPGSLVDTEYVFPITRELALSLGAGTHPVSLVVVGQNDVETTRFSHTLMLADTVPLSVEAVPSGQYHRNDLIVVRGSGFIDASEGGVVAEAEGTFTPEGGAPTTLSREITLTLAPPRQRQQARLRLGVSLGGTIPGTFRGTVRFRSSPGGVTTRTPTFPVEWTFLPPMIQSVGPAEVYLEQFVELQGAGFLDAADDATTIIRVTDATFTPIGGTPQTVRSAELVFNFVNSRRLQMPMSADVVAGRLVSRLFGASTGRFQGTLTPVTVAEREVVGAPVQVEINLSGMKQVVFVKFLPGFYDTLAQYGLTAASGEGVIERRVIERMHRIYEGLRVEATLTQPDAFSPQGYVRLEIGGPDPTGTGLFGYDNNTGKDVENLRLADEIGGANAITQSNGMRGFGGVFAESFFAYSAHPPTGGAGSLADPLFDEIFDGVRATPATLSEVRGTGERSAMINRAIDALASMVGETASHELGHSLGLAQPTVREGGYHNPGDLPGCVMDYGGSRPLAERTSQPNQAVSHFCGENRTYLERLLGSP